MILQKMTDFVLEQRMTSEEINKSSFFDIQTHIATYYDYDLELTESPIKQIFGDA